LSGTTTTTNNNSSNIGTTIAVRSRSLFLPSSEIFSPLIEKKNNQKFFIKFFVYESKNKVLIQHSLTELNKMIPTVPDILNQLASKYREYLRFG